MEVVPFLNSSARDVANDAQAAAIDTNSSATTTSSRVPGCGDSLYVVLARYKRNPVTCVLLDYGEMVMIGEGCIAYLAHLKRHSMTRGVPR